MSALLDVVSWVCIVLGSGFCVIGAVGLIRMPEFYTRTHAASLTDTLGAGLLILGLLCQAGFTLIGFKLVTILALLYITGPTSSHALVKSAYSGGLRFEAPLESEPPFESDGPFAGEPRRES